MAIFIAYPSNIDYLIPDVRIRVGDLEEDRFSDTIVRTSLVSSVKTLQRKWNNRYLVFTENTQIDPLPAGVYYRADYDELVASGITPSPATIIEPGYLYAGLPDGYATIPSGLEPNDVFRNPFFEFQDTSSAPITQNDEAPIVYMACIILGKSFLTSSADSFTSFSDGEFSASNIQTGKTLGSMLELDVKFFEQYFKRRLANAVKAFPGITYT